MPKEALLSHPFFPFFPFSRFLQPDHFSLILYLRMWKDKQLNCRLPPASQLHQKLNNMPHYLKISILALLLPLFAGCTGIPQENPKKELLIFCGITMVRPIQEIASLIEAEQNCIIKIIQGGSGNLLRSIKVNGLGDLYLPGDEVYIKQSLEEKLVTKTVTVGCNHPALIVQKNNPLSISADLKNLADKQYRVVMASAKSSSIGKVTENILRSHSLYQQALNNALYLTTDSKDLTLSIRNKKADLALNWYAVAQWDENREFMDALPLNEEDAPHHRLVLGLLRSSIHPDIAARFMELAASPQGAEIFDRYGIHLDLDRHETTI